MQVEEELAREKDNSTKLENSVTDLSSQCRISLQQMEEFRKEVKEKVSVYCENVSESIDKVQHLFCNGARGVGGMQA